REGTRELLYRAAQMLAELPEEAPAWELPVFRPGVDEETFTVEREEDGWRVRGVRVERLAAMTVWNLDEAVRRFQRTLERMEITKALEEAGVQPGDTVRIGEAELVWEE
ncbi:MAG: Obg family GTPase CgtA, partial [Anaerolineae bacterium]